MGFFDGLLNAVASAGTAVANTMAPGNPLVQGLTAGANGLLSQLGIDKANKQNNQMLEKQMDFQREMFDKQLEANRHSIIDQYRQYKELGINPLSMGMSQTNMVSPSGSPSAQAAVFQSPTERAQVNLLNAQADKTRKETQAIDTEEAPSRTKANLAAAANNNAKTTTEDVLRPFQKQLSQAQYDKAVADTNVAYMQVYELDQTIKQLENQNAYFELDKFYDYVLKDAEFQKLSTETKSLIASIAIAWKDYYDRHAETGSRIAVNYAQADLLKQQKLTEEQNTDIAQSKATQEYYNAVKAETARQLGVPYEEVQRDLAMFRFQTADYDNKTPRIEFDTEMYENTPKPYKKFLWFMDGLSMFGGLASQFAKSYIMKK